MRDSLKLVHVSLRFSSAITRAPRAPTAPPSVGGEEAGQNAAHNQDDEPEHAHDAPERTDLFSKGGLGSTGSAFGLTDRNDIQNQAEETCKHEPGNHAGHEQSAYRFFRDDGIEDEADARRNEDAERSAGGETRAGQTGIIFFRAHFRQRNRGHGNGRCQTVSGNGRKACASGHAGHGQPCRFVPEPYVGRIEKVSADTRMVGNLAHQTEHGNDGENVACGIVERGRAQRAEGGPEIHVQGQHAEHAYDAHGERNGNAEEDEDHEKAHAEHALNAAGKAQLQSAEPPRKGAEDNQSENDEEQGQKFLFMDELQGVLDDLQKKNQRKDERTERRHGDEIENGDFKVERILVREKLGVGKDEKTPCHEAVEDEAYGIAEQIEALLQGLRKILHEKVDAYMALPLLNEGKGSKYHDSHQHFFDLENSRDRTVEDMPCDDIQSDKDGHDRDTAAGKRGKTIGKRLQKSRLLRYGDLARHRILLIESGVQQWGN